MEDDCLALSEHLLWDNGKVEGRIHAVSSVKDGPKNDRVGLSYVWNILLKYDDIITKDWFVLMWLTCKSHGYRSDLVPRAGDDLVVFATSMNKFNKWRYVGFWICWHCINEWWFVQNKDGISWEECLVTSHVCHVHLLSCRGWWLGFAQWQVGTGQTVGEHKKSPAPTLGLCGYKANPPWAKGSHIPPRHPVNTHLPWYIEAPYYL